MTEPLTVLPVPGLPEIQPGADLAALIVAAAPWLRDGDILVVTSKIVSKAEGRLVEIPTDGPEREAAREAALTAETARPVARRGATRIVQTHHGFVMAAAGIDASNVDRSRLVLLPKDPDASARDLRAALRDRHRLDVAVIVSDTMGRPWRNGLTDVALGAAGIPVFRDHRGETDSHGNVLHITQMAVVDELAGAAELVKGKSDQVPVAVVRNYRPATDAAGSVTADLVRRSDQDLFTLGTAEAHAAGLTSAATLPDTPPADADPALVPDPALVAAALTSAARALPPQVTAHHEPATGGIVCARTDSRSDPAAAMELGTAVHRVRAALLAHGLRSTWRPRHPTAALVTVIPDAQGHADPAIR